MHANTQKVMKCKIMNMKKEKKEKKPFAFNYSNF